VTESGGLKRGEKSHHIPGSSTKKRKTGKAWGGTRERDGHTPISRVREPLRKRRAIMMRKGEELCRGVNEINSQWRKSCPLNSGRAGS